MMAGNGQLFGRREGGWLLFDPAAILAGAFLIGGIS